jgi:4'-phosphopantetheinyl transferase
MTVKVWRCDLDRAVASPDPLDEAERARAFAFAFEHLRRRYIAAHVFLRCVLASELGISPHEVAFRATEHNKPYLAEHSRLKFNLSHADHVAYVATTWDAEIGIDVELHHPIEDVLAVAQTVFSRSEIEELSRVTHETRIARFLTCWTRKEAYVKALGVGLGAALPTITVGTDTAAISIPAAVGIASTAFHVQSLECPTGEYVALATSRVPERIVVDRFELAGRRSLL